MSDAKPFGEYPLLFSVVYLCLLRSYQWMEILFLFLGSPRTQSNHIGGVEFGRLRFWRSVWLKGWIVDGCVHFLRDNVNPQSLSISRLLWRCLRSRNRVLRGIPVLSKIYLILAFPLSSVNAPSIAISLVACFEASGKGLGFVICAFLGISATL